MKYCGNCGSELKENQAVCLNCGVKVTGSGEVSSENDVSVGWLIFWIIVFWPGAIIYYLMKSGK